MAAIAVDGLSKTFGNGRPALADVSFSVNPGEFAILAGANGSGKTTLLRHLNGLLAPDRGAVRLFNRPVADDPREARKLCQLVFQDADTQIVGETVIEDVAFGPENLGLDQEAVAVRCRAALSAVGLSGFELRRPHTLSGGEKRRLAIAGALAMEPRIIVLDEPFNSLDYPGSRALVAILEAVREQGRTILLATHDLEKAAALSDRVILLSGGRVVADGPPGNVVGEAEAYGVRVPCSLRYCGEIRPWHI